MLPLAAPCWDCLYFGLFTLQLQSQQGMDSEMGKKRRERLIKFDLIQSGAKMDGCVLKRSRLLTVICPAEK